MKIGDYDYLRRLAAERGQNSRGMAAEKDFQDAVVVFHYVEGHLREQVASLTQALAERDARVAGLTQTVAEHEHTISGILQSRSWKLTRPLRFISRLLGGSMPNLRRRLRLPREWWIVRKSCLFDTSYYLEQNPDVAKAKAGVNPLYHYLRRGAAEGRDPHPLFDTSYYLEQNPDVAKAGVNPLYHYLRRGAAEGRDPHPLFDTSYYLEQYPDVAEERLNPLVHYVGPGIAEGRDPNPNFDTSAYLEQNPEVALQGFNPLVHYLAHAPQLSLSASVAPSAQRNSGGFDLRAALRNEVKESGRLLLDSEYDSNPLVSVVIPCFNQGHFLEDAVLSSLLACSHPLELIVVDDGSTDPRSVALMAELADKYKFSLIRQVNAGRASARNTGIQRARGEFVQLLDADDLLAPGKIDIQLDEFRSVPEIDICISEYELCNAAGLDRRVNNPSTIDGFSLSKEDFLLRWERGLSIPIHCPLFRRKLLEKTSFRLVTHSAHEDWIFWVELSLLSPKFKFNPAVLAAYRIHGRNTTTNHEVMALDFLRACMYIGEAGLNNGNEDFLRDSIRHFRTAYLESIKREAILSARTHTED